MAVVSGSYVPSQVALCGCRRCTDEAVASVPFLCSFDKKLAQDMYWRQIPRPELFGAQ